MKPFDLNDALSGKPVKLRNGSKAYVTGIVPNAIKTDYVLRGVTVKKDRSGDLVVSSTASWTIKGRASLFIDEHQFDIIGMCEEEEPIKYRHINGKKFPEPSNIPPKIGEAYFMVNIEYGATVLKFCWEDSSADNDRLKMGIIHTTKEAAQAHADAINTLYCGEPCSD